MSFAHTTSMPCAIFHSFQKSHHTHPMHLCMAELVCN